MGTITQDSFERKGSKLINRVVIKTLDEYLNYVDYFYHIWKNPELWFRGVSKKDYKLIPSIYREEVWNYDAGNAINIFSQFIRRAKGFKPKYENLDKWGWYQLQQHYGLPTRLLDWTEGSLIGLFFSVRKIEKDISPAVWMIDPFTLNQISVSERILFYSDKLIQDKKDTILNKYIIDNPDLPALPISILPTHLDSRISSQKSTFTIHGSAVDGFDQIFFKDSKFKCVQLLIDPLSAEIIKNKLINTGISEVTLFPDLEGLSRELKWFYDMK